jgi:hypothetical protein
MFILAAFVDSVRVIIKITLLYNDYISIRLDLYLTTLVVGLNNEIQTHLSFKHVKQSATKTFYDQEGPLLAPARPQS